MMKNENSSGTLADNPLVKEEKVRRQLEQASRELAAQAEVKKRQERPDEETPSWGVKPVDDKPKELTPAQKKQIEKWQRFILDKMTQVLKLQWSFSVKSIDLDRIRAFSLKKSFLFRGKELSENQLERAFFIARKHVYEFKPFSKQSTEASFQLQKKQLEEEINPHHATNQDSSNYRILEAVLNFKCIQYGDKNAPFSHLINNFKQTRKLLDKVLNVIQREGFSVYGFYWFVQIYIKSFEILKIFTRKCKVYIDDKDLKIVPNTVFHQINRKLTELKNEEKIGESIKKANIGRLNNIYQRLKKAREDHRLLSFEHIEKALVEGERTEKIAGQLERRHIKQIIPRLYSVISHVPMMDSLKTDLCKTIDVDQLEEEVLLDFNSEIEKKFQRFKTIYQEEDTQKQAAKLGCEIVDECQQFVDSKIDRDSLKNLSEKHLLPFNILNDILPLMTELQSRSYVIQHAKEARSAHLRLKSAPVVLQNSTRKEDIEQKCITLKQLMNIR